MLKNKTSLEYESKLDKDDQIYCLKKIIFAIVGHGAAISMIDNVYKEYYEMQDALHNEA